MILPVFAITVQCVLATNIVICIELSLLLPSKAVGISVKAVADLIKIVIYRDSTEKSK